MALLKEQKTSVELQEQSIRIPVLQECLASLLSYMIMDPVHKVERGFIIFSVLSNSLSLSSECMGRNLFCSTQSLRTVFNKTVVREKLNVTVP